MDANEAPPNPAPATLSEQVRKVLAEAAKPLTVKQVKAGVDKLFPKGTKPAAKPSAAGVQGELERGGAFKHPVGKKSGEPTYWHKAYVPPPTPAELVAKTVREKVAALSDADVVPESKLGKPTGKKLTEETAKAFDDTLADLIAKGELHRHGAKYGKKVPPPPPPPLKWYEKAPHKAKFTPVLKAANKLFEVGGVTLDEVLAALREKLGSPATPVAPKPQPPVSHAPASPPPVAPATDLRTVLNQAYDHLCLFVEFRDKLVELPRLYREASKRMPGLTPEVFQAELWQLGEEQRVQLHIINDVTAAKEPQFAILRDGDLYYYARWN